LRSVSEVQVTSKHLKVFEAVLNCAPPLHDWNVQFTMLVPTGANYLTSSAVSALKGRQTLPIKGTCESARALVLNVEMELTQRQVIGIILWDVTNCSFNINISKEDTVNKDTEPKDPFPIPRKIMAEPDYIDDDNPELIRPQKLINPVKSSRNHQDLHRELLMNQKRGLAPQNKPELQKVMEKRKRDQVIKQQKEEEAQKKKSDLEIELLKRQQKLEQLELEKQKIQEEQENAPEFVKVKGNLRRTVQEATEAPDS
ncbi:hypothetical protein IHE44_0012617, partial [Lamprotornis superbus]